LVLGFLIWTNEVPDSAFLIAAVLIALGVLATVLGLQEPPPEAWRSAHTPETAAAEAPSLSALGLISRYRGTVMFVLVTFAYWSGVNAVLPLVSIYVRDELNTSVGEAQLLPGLLLLSTTFMAIPAAWLGTRFG